MMNSKLIKYCKEHNHLQGHDTPLVNDNGEKCLYYKFCLNGFIFCLEFSDITKNNELYTVLNNKGLMDSIQGLRRRK